MRAEDTRSSRLRAGSPDRFGYEWEKYAEILPESRRQLERWLGSTVLGAFRGRTVLDVGCGMGRNSYWIAREGARRVLAIDIDDRCVAKAEDNLRGLNNAEVKKASIYDLAPALFGAFDSVVCIGVLHHLAEPGTALQALWSCVEDGGDLILWCYGRDGNRMMLPFIQGMRVVVSMLPLPLARGISVMLALAAWPLFKAVPWRTPYYSGLRTLSYRNFESIVFDQLIPRLSHYWSETEIRELVNPIDGTARIESVQGNSWHVKITKKRETRK